MSEYRFRTTLDSADGDTILNIARASNGSVVFDITGRSFNNLNVADAVEIADALYAASGEDDIRKASVKATAGEEPRERSFGDLVEEADLRFNRAHVVAKRGAKTESQKAVADLFQSILGAIIATGDGKAILKALLR